MRNRNNMKSLIIGGIIVVVAGVALYVVVQSNFFSKNMGDDTETADVATDADVDMTGAASDDGAYYEEEESDAMSNMPEYPDSMAERIDASIDVEDVEVEESESL